MLPREVEDGGEKNISNNDKKRRLDHSGRGGSADSIGSPVNTEPLQATYVDDDGGERQALNQPADHVSQLNRGQHVLQIEA